MPNSGDCLNKVLIVCQRIINHLSFGFLRNTVPKEKHKRSINHTVVAIVEFRKRMFDKFYNEIIWDSCEQSNVSLWNREKYPINILSLHYLSAKIHPGMIPFTKCYVRIE